MTAQLTGAADLRRLGYAFAEAKLLLTAVELDLFSALARGPATAAELAAELDLHPRGVPHFLAALTALGLLAESDGRYRNTEVAAEFLVRDRLSFLGGFLARADRMLYPAWQHLGQALRTGVPQHRAPLSAVMAEPAELRRFLAMMDAVNGPLAPALAEAFPWAEHRTVADIGGARGNLLGRLAQAHPGLSGAVFDLPAVKAEAEQHLAGLGVADRVRFEPGDFFTDPLPRAEVLVFGHVLHNWSPAQRVALLRKAHEAVEPRGAVLVYDAMLGDPAELGPLIVSLNMLLVTEGGAEYSARDCAGYLRDAGFTPVSAVPLGARDTLVVARRAEILD
ncbi:methyltransferase [Crossiella sp. SN42]|uniref:methyltransferase n=1 Tax=Crossiella sp. SN42 TaxID=2944808 RepID=UPI00207CB779|nr:methyltransferase [Crossiella sp. SN42]MCO1580323.1 methyltransferase [Crossiella sp. SN42]